MIRQVLGAVAEYERSMVVLRLGAGRRRKAQNGGYAQGAPAFGFEARDRDLVALDDEQETLCRIRELRASGKSYRQICTILDAEDRSARSGRNRPPNPVDSGHPIRSIPATCSG